MFLSCFVCDSFLQCNQKTDIIYNLYITILMPCFDISSSVSLLLIATFMQYMYVCRPDIGIFFLWKQLSSQPLGYFLKVSMSLVKKYYYAKCYKRALIVVLLRNKRWRRRNINNDDFPHLVFFLILAWGMHNIQCKMSGRGLKCNIRKFRESE